jgi:hypothetical protein
VKELWRYPVKSLGGERLDSVRVAKDGVVGDRCWAFVDAASGEIRSAKQLPRLLHFAAGFVPGSEAAPGSYGDAAAEVLVTGPDGARYRARDPRAQAELARAIGASVRLAPLAPPEDAAHYRLSGPRRAEEIAVQMALQTGEPMPDFSGTPPELLRLLAEYATPPGSYVDAYPLHLLTTASLAELGRRSGIDADRLRFRPNLWIETEAARGFPEFDWVGRRLRIGGAILAVESKTIRCSMPAREQPGPGLDEVPRLTAELVLHCKRHLGVYAAVEREGEVRAGDPVALL